MSNSLLPNVCYSTLWFCVFVHNCSILCKIPINICVCVCIHSFIFPILLSNIPISQSCPNILLHAIEQMQLLGKGANYMDTLNGIDRARWWLAEPYIACNMRKHLMMIDSNEICDRNKASGQSRLELFFYWKELLIIRNETNNCKNIHQKQYVSKQLHTDL